MAALSEPSNEGKRRYPPDGVYTGGFVNVFYWTVCTCNASCPTKCNGGCDCKACRIRYRDETRV